MILNEMCKELLDFYMEIMNARNEAATLGMEYAGRGYMEYYTHNLEFYKKIIEGGRFNRFIHFPKILRNRISMRRDKRHLKENRQNILLRKNMEGAKFTHW